MNERLAEKSFWEDYWDKETKWVNPRDYLFNDLLRRYLPQGGDYLEIGCTPGTTMVNFAQTFGYRVTGVDYAQVETVRRTLARFGVHDGRVIEADFTALEVSEQYDVVASYGFVEHFADYASIVAKQAAFVKPGGYLVVEVPNLRYGNWLLYRILRPDLLAKHNLAVMSPVALRAAIAAAGAFEFLYCDYYFTNGLFFDANNPAIAGSPFLKRLVFGARRLLKAVRLDQIPNRWMSPYIIAIARKHAAAPAGSAVDPRDRP